MESDLAPLVLVGCDLVLVAVLLVLGPVLLLVGARAVPDLFAVGATHVRGLLAEATLLGHNKIKTYQNRWVCGNLSIDVCDCSTSSPFESASSRMFMFGSCCLMTEGPVERVLNPLCVRMLLSCQSGLMTDLLTVDKFR